MSRQELLAQVLTPDKVPMALDDLVSFRRACADVGSDQIQEWDVLTCSYCGREIDPDSDYWTQHDESCPNCDQEPDEDGLQFHVDCDCDNYMCTGCIQRMEEAEEVSE